MRILIVDDAPPLRTVLTRTALSLVAETRPDAIVVDGRLKGAGVIALFGQLRSVVPQASLFLVASLGETALVRAAREAGAAGVLARPFLPSRIAAALRDLQHDPR